MKVNQSFIINDTPEKGKMRIFRFLLILLICELFRTYCSGQTSFLNYDSVKDHILFREGKFIVNDSIYSLRAVKEKLLSYEESSGSFHHFRLNNAIAMGLSWMLLGPVLIYSSYINRDSRLDVPVLLCIIPTASISVYLKIKGGKNLRKSIRIYNEGL